MAYQTGSKIMQLAKDEVVSSILDAIGVSFYVIDAHGNYVIINDIATRKISGILNAELVDKKIWENCRRAMESGEKIIAEEFFEGQWYLSIKQPLFDNEQCVGVMVLNIDITTQKKGQENVVQLAKEKMAALNEKANNLQLLSHCLTRELSNAFNSVKNRIDTLQVNVPLIGNVAVGMKITKMRRHQLFGMIDMMKLVKKALDSATTLFEITSMNLRMAKIRKDKFAMCSIAEALRIAIRDYPFQEGEGRLLHCDFCHDFHFYGIEIYVTHIFINLFKNAFRAIKTANHGEIFVTFAECELDFTSKKKRLHKVIVKDTAAGIPKDFMPKLFMPFASRNDGMGLGLAFCKNVMRSFGGDISCASQVGKCTEFTLSFLVGGY